MRLGKSERALRKQQWAQYRAVRAEVIADNLMSRPAPVVRYRTVNMDMGFRFNDPSNLPRVSRPYVAPKKG